MDNTVLDGAIGIAVLLSFGVVGVAALHRTRLGLTGFECFSYGVPAGIVSMSLVLLGLAILAGGLSAGLVLGGAVASVLLGLVLWPGSRPHARRAGPHDGRRSPRSIGIISGPMPSLDPINLRHLGPRVARRAIIWRQGPLRVQWGPVIVLGALVLLQAWFWESAIRFEDGMLVSSQQNVWGDWGMHLGDVTSFLWGSNFPPTHPRLAGEPMSYHYLSSFTAAAVASLGIHPVLAMKLQSFLLSVFIIFGLYAFGCRVIGQRLGALLVPPLFLFGSGFGSIAMLGQLDGNVSGATDLLDEQVFNRETLRDLGYHLANPEYIVQAQRGYLYGIPLALLTISLLLMGVRRIHWRADGRAAAATLHEDGGRSAAVEWWRRSEIRLFAAAGVAAGIMPIGHFSTVYALMLAIPFIAVLSTVVWPMRPFRRVWRSFVPLVLGWAIFGIIWVLLTGPQVFWVYGGELGGTSSLRVQLGWMAGDEPWWFFWGKNIGMFAALFVVAVFATSSLDGVTKRFFLGFSAIFVLCNIFAFLPWDWNNALFLQYWFLSVAIFVAALIGHTWARFRNRAATHVVMAALVLSLTGLGLLVHLNHVTTDDRWVLLGPEGLQLSERIREETPEDAVFVSGTAYSNPIAVMSGRTLVLGYTTWLWTQGMDYAEQEQDVHAIIRFHPFTPYLLFKHDVDYVAIGPWEREHLQANDAAFRERYPIAIETENWVVFDVRDDGAIGG